MDGERGYGDHALVARGASEMLLTLMAKQFLLIVESPVAIVAEDPIAWILCGPLFLTPHC